VSSKRRITSWLFNLRILLSMQLLHMKPCQKILTWPIRKDCEASSLLNDVPLRKFLTYNDVSVSNFHKEDVSSRIRPERPQFAPNDPYFSTVGGQPSLPWPDDSHTHRYTRAVSQVGVVLHNVWHSISHESARPHAVHAVAVSQRARMPCVPL